MEQKSNFFFFFQGKYSSTNKHYGETFDMKLFYRDNFNSDEHKENVFMAFIKY